MLLRDVVDQLLDQDGLADARASEEADLAALHVRGDQVDDLDPGLEDLDRRGQLAEARRIPVDRPPLGLARILALVDRVTDHVPEPAERHVPDGHGDRLARVLDVEAAGEPVGRVHGDGADAIVSEVLLHLCDQLAVVDGDAKRGVDRRQLVREDDVDDDALDLDDLAPVFLVRISCHEPPASSVEVEMGGAI